MSGNLRWFIVDDRDTSALQYSGTWADESGSNHPGASFGPVYLNTLRRTTTNGASVSFTFTGKTPPFVIIRTLAEYT